MPSRLPVTVGTIRNLQPTTASSVKAQMLEGDSTITKEKLLAMGHGVVRAEQQDSVASDERAESDVGNPLGWENNAARKQLDMQWHFTCGPLRVSQHAGKNHWARLHATNTSVLPQPGGGLHVMTSSVPHCTDAELEAKAARVGVSQRALRKAQGLPPIQPTNPPSTPVMRQFLKNNAAMPLPRRVSDGSVFTDGSSAFSRTTVAASQPTKRAGSVGGSGSIVGRGSNALHVADAQFGGSCVSGAGRQSNVSQASKRSAADSIRVDVERERTKQRDLAAELKAAAQRLAALEELLEK